MSSRAYAESEHTYVENCTITFINDIYETNLTYTSNYWYNISIEISTSEFKLGLNYVYIKFTRTNYTTVTFSFQILVKQINIEVDIIDFEDIESSLEIIIFPTVLEKYRENVLEDKIVKIKGKLDKKEDQVKMLANEIEELKKDDQKKEELKKDEQKIDMQKLAGNEFRKEKDSEGLLETLGALEKAKEVEARTNKNSIT